LGGLSKRNLVVFFFVVFKALPSVVKLRWNVGVDGYTIAIGAVYTSTLAAVSALLKIVSSEYQIAIFIDDVIEVFNKGRGVCHNLKNVKKTALERAAIYFGIS
jgi:hypothetical protein